MISFSQPDGVNDYPDGSLLDLELRLEVRIPVSRFHGDVHLSPEEKKLPPPGTELGVPEHFWIIVAGGKHDFTAKWWNPESYQVVVDHYRGKIRFVQCGESHHWHPRLKGAVDLVGKTSPREFIRLMYHADGVVCPVTFAMHLAAAVETKAGHRGQRPCVVIAGGREPAHWEAYPQHQFLSTNGALPCCRHGGCWKSRCQLVHDGDPKDTRDVCERPVQITPDLRIAKCLDMIRPQDVIRCIDLYYEGGAMTISNGHAGQVFVLPQQRRLWRVERPENGDHANLGRRGMAGHRHHAVPLLSGLDYPVVPVEQNGSGVAASRKEYFDEYGNLTWSMDERGFITRRKYDIVTGALTQQIDDVDTAQVSDEPTGWETPTGGGLHLISDFESDVLGRPTQQQTPIHSVDMSGSATSVRMAAQFNAVSVA